jgi:competence protein ComEC
VIARVAPAHVYALAVCAGLAFANVVRLHGVAVAAASLAAVAVVAAGPPPARLVLAALVLAVAGWWWASTRLDALDRSALAPLVGRAGDATMVVTSEPRVGMFDIRAQGRLSVLDGRHFDEPVELELPLGRSPPQGAVIAGLAIVKAPKGPSNGFDERTWLRHQGIHVVLRVASWQQVGARGGFGRVVDRLHRWLGSDAAYSLTGERRAIVDAVVLGETQGLDQTLLARFRASGLYHVLAVDGLKVTAVAGGAAGLAFLLGAGRILAELLGGAAVAGYVLAVGARPSVIRAAIAAALLSLAWIAGRQRDRWQALLVAAIALLAWNPYFVFDAGFQLSFAAVSAIFVVAGPAAHRLQSRGVPHWLAQLAGVSTACGVGTAPVTWLQFHQISLVTVPANIVGVPVVAEMLGLALLTALVAPVLPPLASLLAQANGLAASFEASWARFAGGLPFAQVSSPRGLAAAGTLLFGAYAWRRCRTT